MIFRALARLGFRACCVPVCLCDCTEETHDWREDHSNQHHIGQFGFHSRIDDAEIRFQRIVQLGYAIGPVDAEVTTKKFYVTPEGFEVSAKATKLHGISQETLMAAGKPLEEVLREFMTDVVDACSKGGRVVAHQIEVSFLINH